MPSALPRAACSPTRRVGNRTDGWRTTGDQRQHAFPQDLFRLTVAETERYSVATTKNGGCAIRTIGMPGRRPLLLVGVVVALAATTGAAWLHEIRPRPVAEPTAQTSGAR